jgi:hypothetical protein
VPYSLHENLRADHYEREGEQRLGDHSHVGGSDRKRHSVKPSAASLLSYY